MEITINDEQFEVVRPRGNEWRELAKFMDLRKDLTTVDYVDKHNEIIAILANNKDLTAEYVIKNAYVDETLAAYYALSDSIVGALNAKLKQIPPNLETPKDPI